MKEVIGYCSYCKEPIYETDAHVVKCDNQYHINCWKQLNLFDPDNEMEVYEE